MTISEPTEHGSVERDGVRIAWELRGRGPGAITFPPVFNIVDSRLWKAQVPWLARHHRVLTIDPRGNGRSDRPHDPARFDPFQIAEDVVAALDASAVERTVLVGNSIGSIYSSLAAALHPDRVAGIVHIGTGMNLTGTYDDPLSEALARFEDDLDDDEGWSTFNARYWARDWEGGAAFFIDQALSDAHSGQPIEDARSWARDADPRSAIALMVNASRADRDSEGLRRLVTSLPCEHLVVHGTEDGICDYSWGQALAEALEVPLHTIDGGGHCPQVRFPALVNGMICDFADEVLGHESASPPPPPAPPVPPSSGPRVLYLSSPIGLGHARRDLAVAHALRELVPDARIEWLAQDPVTRFLAAEGESVHPASAHLAGESAFLEREAGEHDLHVFEAFRKMDTVLVNNFGVFRDLVDDEPYDLVIGDEAWEVDLFLHEHPNLKRARFAWLTDFVGYLPMPAGGPRDEWFAADYNAWSIENVERNPDVRDLALFVGDPDDVVDRTFGPGLPPIREWVDDHYDFCGYITGFDPAELADRSALREELGYRPDETVVVATVGGSGVGSPLLRRIIGAHASAAEEIDGLRTIVVTGPRIDPDSLPAATGVEKVAFVPDLHRHLAAADLGVVQGGLTTTMELTATGRPFLYFPLQNHFEQQIHVRHRLERHRAGTPLDYTAATPEVIAEAMVAALGDRPAYRPVPADGAARAASAISALL